MSKQASIWKRLGWRIQGYLRRTRRTVQRRPLTTVVIVALLSLATGWLSGYSRGERIVTIEWRMENLFQEQFADARPDLKGPISVPIMERYSELRQVYLKGQEIRHFYAGDEEIREAAQMGREARTRLERAYPDLVF